MILYYKYQLFLFFWSFIKVVLNFDMGRRIFGEVLEFLVHFVLKLDPESVTCVLFVIDAAKKHRVLSCIISFWLQGCLLYSGNDFDFSVILFLSCCILHVGYPSYWSFGGTWYTLSECLKDHCIFFNFWKSILMLSDCIRLKIQQSAIGEIYHSEKFIIVRLDSAVTVV